jgi:hypothetical protein
MLCGSLLATVATMLSAQPLSPPSSPSSLLLFSLSYYYYCCYIIIIIIIILISMYCPRNTLLTHSVTDHMIGHHNIYAVHSGLFHWSLIYSKNKSSVCHTLSEFCCLVVLCCVVSACLFLFPHQHFHRAYMQPCMTLNSFFFLSTCIAENIVTEATMATRV